MIKILNLKLVIKNIFRKGYLPYWFNEMFMTKKIKNTVPWRYVISDLKGEEIG